MRPPATFAAAASTAVLLAAALLAPDAQTTWHVSSGGSDTNRGTASSPFRTVQKAADVVRPGDTILVHAGLNVGHVQISRSGTPSAPITLRGEGQRRTVITSSLRAVPCSGSRPPEERTIMTQNGADWWIVEDLVIEGGILISGDRAQRIRNQTRNRSLPGRGRRDPADAAGTLASFDIDPADGWVVEDNDVLGRGIRVVAGRGGRIEDNEVHDIDCGTGGGIALANFSDQWVVRDNHVHDVEASERHFMSEGIRVSGASMYNTIEGNVVEDVQGAGRGYGFDVNSGWNVVRGNVARRAEQGFSEQAGTWGNQWIGNLSEDNRRSGFSVYGLGSRQRSPTDRTPSTMTIECNRSSGDAVGFAAGGLQQSSFRRNDFRTVSLSPNLRSYWSRVGNTWDGSPEPPPETVPPVPPCNDAAAGRAAAERSPADARGRGDGGRGDRRASPRTADGGAEAVPDRPGGRVDGGREGAGSAGAGVAGRVDAPEAARSAGDAAGATDTSAGAAGHPRLWGDVNRDGAVDTADALVVLTHVNGSPVEGEDLSVADVDADSLVTAGDAAVILNYSVDLDTGAARVGRPAD